MLGDVNGDGRADIVGFGNGGVAVALGRADGKFATPADALVGKFGADAAAGAWRVEQHPRMLGDVNGDGRADIVGFGNGGVSVALGRADGKFAEPTDALPGKFGYVAGAWRVEQHPRMLGDVNGDGRADIVGFGNDGVVVAP